MKAFFPQEEPLGRRLAAFTYDPVEQAADAFTIVGVVGDVRSRGLGTTPDPEAYFAHEQVPRIAMFVVVRTAGDPRAEIDGIRKTIMALDPSLPAPPFNTLDQVVSDSLDRPRFFTALLSSFSAVALGLATVGIFGLLSFAVARRTREMGLRIALGAPPAALMAMILRQALSLVAIGVGIGIPGALVFTRMLQGELFGVTAGDPIALAGVAGVLVATALLATAVPAWRAATADPLTAIRSE